MDRWLDRFCRWIDNLIAAALAVMVVLVFGNVVLRYGFNSGITVSEEVSRWLFIWVTFLGAVVALKERAHLGVDMVVQRLPVVGRKACLVAGQLLMIWICWLLARGSWAQVKINWEVAAPTTGAPMAIVYGAGLVFAVLAGAILLIEFARVATGRVKDADLIMVQESEEAAALQQILENPHKAQDAARP